MHNSSVFTFDIVQGILKRNLLIGLAIRIFGDNELHRFKIQKIQGVSKPVKERFNSVFINVFGFIVERVYSIYSNTKYQKQRRAFRRVFFYSLRARNRNKER